MISSRLVNASSTNWLTIRSKRVRGEIPYNVAKRKIKNVLGFATTLDVDDGIRELLFALKTGIIRNPTDEKYRNAQFIVQ